MNFALKLIENANKLSLDSVISSMLGCVPLSEAYSCSTKYKIMSL
jgi:hypothetical protein